MEMYHLKFKASFLHRSEYIFALKCKKHTDFSTEPQCKAELPQPPQLAAIVIVNSLPELTRLVSPVQLVKLGR